MEKTESKRTWGQWFFDLTSGKDHKAVKAGGSAAIVGSVAYGVLSGDIVGAGVGVVGGIGLRFRDKIQSFLDFVDREENIKAQLEAALKAPKTIVVQPGMKPFLAPDVVKAAFDEAAKKLEAGKELTPADQLAIAVGESL